MSLHIHEMIGTLKTNLINTAFNVALNGVSKLTSLASITAIASIAALYITQPQTLVSQLLIVGMSLGGSYIANEGLYFIAGNIHQKAMAYFWKQAFKELPNLPENQKKEITDLLNSLDLDSIIPAAKQK